MPSVSSSHIDTKAKYNYLVATRFQHPYTFSFNREPAKGLLFTEMTRCRVSMVHITNLCLFYTGLNNPHRQALLAIHNRSSMDKYLFYSLANRLLEVLRASLCWTVVSSALRASSYVPNQFVKILSFEGWILSLVPSIINASNFSHPLYMDEGFLVYFMYQLSRSISLIYSNTILPRTIEYILAAIHCFLFLEKMNIVGVTAILEEA